MDADELELARLLGPFGDISTIKIVRDRKTGHCKGYAFVEMVSRFAADNAIAALHDTKMADRVLTLNIVEEDTTSKRPDAETLVVRPATQIQVHEKYPFEVKRKRPRKAQAIKPVHCLQS